MPLLTIANQLQKRNKGVKILYVGSGDNLERKLVEKINLEYRSITTGKLRRYFSWQNLIDLVRIPKGVFEAYKIIKVYRPHLIFSKGGYVSFPVCLAGYFKKVPIVLHESDSVMGLANRLIARMAKRICYNFKLAPIKEKYKYIFTGIPVRKKVLKGKVELARKQLKFSSKKPVLLIMGGSQGAQFINDLVYDVLDKLLIKFKIIHVCGQGKRRLIKRIGYVNFEYVGKELGNYYALSDLIISRAGANSLAEISAIQKPNMIIPLPSSANNHQQKNAEFFQNQNASVVLSQKNLDSQIFLKTVFALFENKNAQKGMRKNLKKLYNAKATDKIIEIIEKTINTNSQ